MLLYSATPSQQVIRSLEMQVNPQAAEQALKVSAYARRYAQAPPAEYRFLPNPSLRNTGFGGAVHESLDDGLAEMVHMARSSENERSWTYIPALSLWIDDCTMSTDRRSVSDGNLRSYLMNRFSDLEFVHLHPSSTMLQLFKEGIRTAQYLREAAVPAEADLGEHALQASRSGGCRLRSHVASHYGVTTYELTADPAALLAAPLVFRSVHEELMRVVRAGSSPTGTIGPFRFSFRAY
jgi:hypothetical protein